MLVSLHLPKTAGSSFRHSLQGYFGPGLRIDYADKPLGLCREDRNAAAHAANCRLRAADFAGVECVHGHFLPHKYAGLGQSMPLQFIAWLRHPLQRLCSHYHYWRQDPYAEVTTALRKQMLEENWSLREFALHPQLRNIYGEFLWRFPLESFSFIGITEYYAADLAQFSAQFLTAELAHHSSNVGSRPDKAHYELDAELREELEFAHQLDMQIYARALEMREQRRIL